jgi:ABC-2 type transport system permease protein
MREALWLPSYTLWRREMVRFFRQRSRVTGSLLTPVLFWLLFGGGFGGSFRPAGAEETGSFDFFLPGTALLIVLFTSIFANISIIEDRREGFLQGVLVAPVARLAIVLGKVAGGATIALLQAALFLGVASLSVGGFPGGEGSSLPLAAAALLLVSLGITALGFVFAWRLDTVQAFHGVMNLLLMPMWALSGALFPAEGAALPLRILMTVNPATYGLALLRHGLGAVPAGTPSLALAAGVTVAFTTATLLVAAAVAGRRTSTA